MRAMIDITSASIQDLERRRKEAGVSIYGLCKQADIAESLYHRWKKRKVTPGLESLRKAYLGLDKLTARKRKRVA